MNAVGSLSKISNTLWIASFFGLALFAPFSISGANISIMFGFLASLLAIFFDASARARYRASLRDPMCWASILLVVSAIPSVLMSENISRALRDWKSYWLLLIYFLLAYNLVSIKMRQRVVWTLVASMTISSMVALIQRSGGLDLLLFQIEGESYRPSGTLYTMTFAGILYQVITVTFAMALMHFRPKSLVIRLGALVLQIAALLFTLTRGAWLALLGGLGAVPLLLRRRSVLFVAVAMVVLGSVIAVGNVQLRERAATIAQNISNPTDKNIATRLTLWNISWELFKRNPALGIGMGDYTIEADKLVRERRVRTTVDSHNIYLHVLATRGVLGFVPFVLWWIVLIRTLFLARRSLAGEQGFGYHFVTGVIGATVAVLIGALSENNIDDSEVFIAFMFLVGIAKSFALNHSTGTADV